MRVNEQMKRLALNLMCVDELYSGSFTGILEVALAAEERGIDVVVLPDHLALNGQAHARRAGFPYPITANWFEPTAALGAIAGMTRRIRLGTSVLVAPLRPGLLLAKQIAALDSISAGRMEMTFGVGWQPQEFEAAGIKFADRWRILDEQLLICRSLWGTPPASHPGRLAPFHDLHSYPLPPQGAALPVYLGGKLNAAHVDRIARRADGWAPPVLAHEEFKAGVTSLRTAAEKSGRDASSLAFTAIAPWFPHATRAGQVSLSELVAELAMSWKSGADTVVVHPAAFCASARDVPRLLTALLEARG